MKSLEEGTNNGGVFADAMGFRKTISACIELLDAPVPEHHLSPNFRTAAAFYRDTIQHMYRDHVSECLAASGNAFVQIFDDNILQRYIINFPRKMQQGI
jgi:hypothetical protein